ncbi:hypothetical protein MLPF_1010 [Mycobacterium lepromatosis]|nr:hypothetical protein MLPF_1010 [Mycobacterium lepromatosis]
MQHAAWYRCARPGGRLAGVVAISVDSARLRKSLERVDQAFGGRDDHRQRRVVVQSQDTLNPGSKCMQTSARVRWYRRSVRHRRTTIGAHGGLLSVGAGDMSVANTRRRGLDTKWSVAGDESTVVGLASRFGCQAAKMVTTWERGTGRSDREKWPRCCGFVGSILIFLDRAVFAKSLSIVAGCDEAIPEAATRTLD